MSNISVFGSTGFIGKKWMSLYEDISIAEPRESINPISKNILYLRSTNSNYNVLKDASIDIRSNLLLLTETLNNLKKNSNFLLTSSWFVYGKNNIHLNNEESPCNPTGFYSITKYTQEQLLKSFCGFYYKKPKENIILLIFSCWNIQLRLLFALNLF